MGLAKLTVTLSITVRVPTLRCMRVWVRVRVYTDTRCPLLQHC